MFHNVPNIKDMIIFGISKLEEKNVKKIVGIAILLLVCGSILCGSVAAIEEPVGPADNSGDGVSDGSGF